MTKETKEKKIYFFKTKDIKKFPELSTYPDFLALESIVQRFWKENNVLKEYLRLNSESEEKFSFFDGPITANNPMGVHHAWGRTIKDAVLRYQTFKGKRLRYQNGFDCQGLWIEVQVEKSLKLNSKKDILEFGLDNFSQACRKRVDDYGSLITEQSQQLGQFMAWENSYWTHSDKNIEHIWHFLEVCHKNGWLYKGHKLMPWCTRCETSLSQHEQSDSYKELVHPSIFVQFLVLEPSEMLKTILKDKILSFLVWTTTPWTLPANVAVAVNPDLNYAVVENPVDNNLFVVGEVAYNKLKFLKKFSKIASFTGKDLLGTQLNSLTKNFVPRQNDIKIQVLSADFVTEDDGTGLVHIAPGCGLDDFELGKEYNLHFLSPLNEDGTFREEFGFKGKNHLEVSKLVSRLLKDEGTLFHYSSLKHRYPVCWRCNQELVFRLVDEWFLKTDEIRPKLLAAVETVTWHPYYMKDQMKNWLTNMGDWCISRNRFWGLPLPFFECNCGQVTVVSKIQELYSKAGFSSEEEFRKVIPDLHRPYVDDLQIFCSHCGNKVNRILSVGDCWLDAGIVPFSTLNYLESHDNNSLWNEWFPADFVVEMREQIRLWFYSMLFMSVTLTGRAPYKTVMAYEKVLDEQGNAMHRSKGNAIWWSETATKVGSDANRLFYTSWDPTKSLLYGYNNLHKSLNKFNTFWSCCRFFQQNINLSSSYWNQVSKNLKNLILVSKLDFWLVFNLEKTHKLVNQYYQEYKLEMVRDIVDNFWIQTSNFWLRNRRNHFWSYEQKNTTDSNLVVYQLLWQAIVLGTFWLAPIAPHVSEYLFQLLVRPFKKEFEYSLHLNKFYDPEFPNSSNNLSIDEEVQEVEKLLDLGRTLRQNAKIKNRYVLPVLYLFSENTERLMVLKNSWNDILTRDLNVKEIKYQRNISTTKFVSISKFNYELSVNLVYSEELKLEWFQADILRTIQFLRKEANLSVNQRTEIVFKYDSKLKLFLTNNFKDKLYSDALIDINSDLKSLNNGKWLKKDVLFEETKILVFLKVVN